MRSGMPASAFAGNRLTAIMFLRTGCATVRGQRAFRSCATAEPAAVTAASAADTTRVGLGARRNRRAMRVGRRFTDRRGHAVDQLIGRRVLESLGLFVHAIPRVTERAGEIRFDDAMATNGPQGGAAS